MKRCKMIIPLLLACMVFLCSSALADERMMPSGFGFVYADDWLYRTNYAHGQFQLVRTRTDGSGAQLLSQGRGVYPFFCVVDDTVYFLGNEKELGGFDTRSQIWAVSTDGQNERPLTDLNDYISLFASESHVYAECESDYEFFYIRYSMKPWAKANQFPISLYDYNHTIAGGWLYYLVDDGEHKQIRRMQPDAETSDSFLMFDDKRDLDEWCIESDYLYYSLTDHVAATAQLWCAPLNGGESRLISDAPVSIGQFNSGWAYGRHISPGGPSYDGIPSPNYGDAVRINLQTGELMELGNRSPTNFLAAGDKLIYYESNEDKRPLVMDADASNPRRMTELGLVG